MWVPPQLETELEEEMQVTREQWEILYRYQSADTVEKRHVYAWKALAEETTRLYEALPKDLRVRFSPWPTLRDSSRLAQGNLYA